MFNLIFIWITIIFFNFLSKTIKLIKIFCLKLYKVNFNIILKTIVFDIYNYILIKLIYSVFIKNIMLSYLNIYAIIKKNFKINYFKIM